MKKYKILRNCVGFQGRYWEEGKIVELEDDDNPPHHFQLIGSEKELPSFVDTRVDPMKPLPNIMGRPVKPIGGFAGSQEFPVPKPMETAGQVLKKSPGRPRKNI